jgi:hypothetical protein
MRITFGPSYASLGSVAWIFALQGTALALTQLMIVNDIARARRGVLWLVVVAAALETVAVLVIAPHTISGLITIATVTAVVLGILSVWRSIAVRA